MSSLNKVRTAEGVELSISEWIHDPLFTTIEFGASASIDFIGFNYVRGERVTGSTTTSGGSRQANERDTNIFRRKKLNQDEAFVVHAVTYEAFSLDDAEDSASPPNTSAPSPAVSGLNLRRLQRDLMFELLVGAHITKPQIEAPFEYLNQSVGSPAWASGDLNSVHVGTAGYPTADNQKLLKLPLYIGGFGEHAKVGNSQHFEIRLYHAVGGSVDGLDQDVRLRFYLDGLRKRPA